MRYQVILNKYDFEASNFNIEILRKIEEVKPEIMYETDELSKAQSKLLGAKNEILQVGRYWTLVHYYINDSKASSNYDEKKWDLSALARVFMLESASSNRTAKSTGEHFFLLDKPKVSSEDIGEYTSNGIRTDALDALNSLRDLDQIPVYSLCLKKVTGQQEKYIVIKVKEICKTSLFDKTYFNFAAKSNE